jgi:hypothetical protein
VSETVPGVAPSALTYFTTMISPAEGVNDVVVSVVTLSADWTTRYDWMRDGATYSVIRCSPLACQITENVPDVTDCAPPK